MRSCVQMGGGANVIDEVRRRLTGVKRERT